MTEQTHRLVVCPECGKTDIRLIMPVGASQDHLTLDQLSLFCLNCASHYAIDATITADTHRVRLRTSR